MKFFVTILLFLFCCIGYGQSKNYDQKSSEVRDIPIYGTTHDHRWCNMDSLYHSGWEMYAGKRGLYFYRNPEHLLSIRKQFIKKHK